MIAARAELYLAWLTADPDHETRAELAALIDAADSGDEAARAELVDAFSQELRFGTAGARGKLGPGPNRVNRVVLRRIAAGIAAWLDSDKAVGGVVVIGYDGRNKSETFAADVAEVLAGAGYEVVLYDQVVPTPVLAFAARRNRARCAVMITASHNPATDNGIKLYDASGSQILPADAAKIEAARAAEPVAGTRERSEVVRTPAEAEILAYKARVLEFLGPVADRASRRTTMAYTALHGVGGRIFEELFHEAGLGDLVVVEAQHHPDPEFPTTAFPNPEESGALALLNELCVQSRAVIGVANDPDADRSAAAVRTEDGRYRQLTGDQIGAVLLWWLVRSGRCPAGSTTASSLVSSDLTAAMAEAYGLTHRRTLTGFKWISRVENLAYGYEEALGYCLDPEAVRDKDGILAGLLLCVIAAELHTEGRSIESVLGEIDDEFGAHRQHQLTIPTSAAHPGEAVLTALMENIPTHLVGIPVLESYRLDDTSRSGVDTPTEGVVWRLGGRGGCRSARVIIRPSGTEPKLKVYLECVAASAAVAEYHLNLLAHDLAWRLQNPNTKKETETTP